MDQINNMIAEGGPIVPDTSASARHMYAAHVSAAKAKAAQDGSADQRYWLMNAAYWQLRVQGQTHEEAHGATSGDMRGLVRALVAGGAA